APHQAQELHPPHARRGGPHASPCPARPRTCPLLPRELDRSMHRRTFLAASAGAAGALALGAAPAHAGRRPARDPEALITRWFTDTYRSLEAMVADSGLPADNIRLGGDKPVPARNTSTTNIGCWLWSTVAAAGLGVISESEMHRRLARTVATVEKME